MRACKIPTQELPLRTFQILPDPSRPDAVDVNAWRGDGATVLFAAARRGDAAVLAALLLAAADPNCRARDGRRALQHGENQAVKARPWERWAKVRKDVKVMVISWLFYGIIHGIYLW